MEFRDPLLVSWPCLLGGGLEGKVAEKHTKMVGSVWNRIASQIPFFFFTVNQSIVLACVWIHFFGSYDEFAENWLYW